MENPHKRKKQPELVRRTLLDCAAKLAVDEGLSGVTIQAVADAAGVTKGGLMHHFPNKQALIEAITADLLEQLDVEIDKLMGIDSESFGSFTRAYVELVFTDNDAKTGSGKAWSALSVTSITDPRLRDLWSNWLEGRLERHQETDHVPTLAIVRLAADGVWLASMLNNDSRRLADLKALRTQLLAMTRKDGQCASDTSLPNPGV